MYDLPAPRLTVGEDGAIVPIHNILDGRSDREIEDIGLLRGHVEDSVESKGRIRLGRLDWSVYWAGGCGGTYTESAGFIALELDNGFAAMGNFDLILRAEAGNN